jgi:hypothetical protein
VIEVIYDSRGLPVAEIVQSPIVHLGRVIYRDWWLIRGYGRFPLALAIGTYHELRQRIDAVCGQETPS